MIDFDLERLGDVWRAQPDPAEMARLQLTAAAVSRRARIGRLVDIVAAIAVALVVFLLVLSNPRTETFLMGGAAILVLLASNIRQRKLRQIELKGLTGSTEDMLDQSIDRLETTLRHNRFSLVAMGPVLLIAALFAAVSQQGASPLVDAIQEAPMLRLASRGFALVTLSGIVLFLILAIRRGRRDLKRLRAMRESYRLEGETPSP
jgi:uncharacterized membrane protein YraQ (UPF0718 family)